MVLKGVKVFEKNSEWDSEYCGCGTSKLATHVNEAWSF